MNTRPCYIEHMPDDLFKEVIEFKNEEQKRMSDQYKGGVFPILSQEKAFILLIRKGLSK